MITFSERDVSTAISGICQKFGITLNTTLQQEYQNGKHPTLLTYEKVDKITTVIPVIQKYLIGAQTFLNQPCQFYDIYRSCRHVIFTQILNNALDVIINKVNNYDLKLERLRQETRYDPFESILYEVVVAANYASSSDDKTVNFLDESSSETPDFEVLSENGKMYVECKKFDRAKDLVSDLRNVVRDKLKLTMNFFLTIRQSSLLEISFHIDPQLISDTKIRDVCLESFKTGTPVTIKEITVNVKCLKKQELHDFTLYPSPKYFWERYGYRDKSEWAGIICALNARYAHHKSVIGSDYSLSSTWLDEVDYECAVKWKVTDEKIILSQKRLGYTRLFKGLSQLQSKSFNSVLHVWYERDSSIGHRKGELLDFFNRLALNSKDIFGWIIFNETSLDVSVDGRFDLIEYAHPIGGPHAKSKHPPITTVFVGNDNNELGFGEFGIGHKFPDIDQ